MLDTSPWNFHTRATILIGEGDGGYGRNLPDSVRNVKIRNINSNCWNAILNNAYLTDATIENVVNRNPRGKLLFVVRKEGMKNVSWPGVIE